MSIEVRRLLQSFVSSYPNSKSGEFDEEEAGKKAREEGTEYFLEALNLLEASSRHIWRSRYFDGKTRMFSA